MILHNRAQRPAFEVSLIEQARSTGMASTFSTFRNSQEKSGGCSTSCQPRSAWTNPDVYPYTARSGMAMGAILGVTVFSRRRSRFTAQTSLPSCEPRQTSCRALVRGIHDQLHLQSAIFTRRLLSWKLAFEDYRRCSLKDQADSDHHLLAQTHPNASTT
jgi:hypothetical protein